MKTESKVLSSFLAAAVWADGEYDEFEKEFVNEVGDVLEIKTLLADLEKTIKETEKMNEDQLASFLETAAKKVDAEEKEGVLTLCLQLMCADAFLAIEEVENFLAFADILGIDEDKATAILDEFVAEEEDLIIEE
ncbi:MAG: hypothetical protein J5606_09445 [Bacteroidales bacterium]|nr:hypothetical protein [Bacteroidales bacterium]